VIVVSDTSPVTNLAAVGPLGLLRELFGQVEIPEAVWRELTAEDTQWQGRDAVAASPWIVRHRSANVALFTALRRDLDPGESESIALALELSADLILMDERDGRHQAKRLGLNTMGVLGVLLLAKHKGLIKLVRPLLDSLREQAHFWVSQSLYQRVLIEAGEAP
jgi:predicted nucleic acid-binding protein